jgi:DNA-binding ferritin-like protein
VRTTFGTEAQEKAAALDDRTTAALFGKLTRAINTQIWFLRSP